MKFFKPCLTASALALSTFVMLSPIGTASAMTITTGGIAQALSGVQTGLPVIKVQRGNRRYNRNRHGYRYRNRRGRHRHYYNGYWYAMPFWLGAAAAAGAYAAPAPSYRGGGGFCAQKSDACADNWGASGPDYEGCMRYEGC